MQQLNLVLNTVANVFDYITAVFSELFVLLVIKVVF